MIVVEAKMALGVKRVHIPLVERSGPPHRLVTPGTDSGLVKDGALESQERGTTIWRM